LIHAFHALAVLILVESSEGQAETPTYILGESVIVARDEFLRVMPMPLRETTFSCTIFFSFGKYDDTARDHIDDG
jgi:hypothetical protein